MTNRSIKIIVSLVFFMVYIIPIGLIFGPFNAIHNHIFATIIGLIYISLKIKSWKIKKIKLYIWILVFIVSIYTKKFGFIDMIIIPILNDFIRCKNEIKNVVYKSNIAYFSIAATMVYSVMYRILGIGGRGEGEVGSGLIFTAIGEVNLTGLSLFCLALIVRKKNKFLGNVVATLGILTVSRSYMLALISVFVFNIKIIRKAMDKLIDKCTYLNFTIISSVVLFGLGIYNVYLYLNGMIVSHSLTEGFGRLFVFNDLSNYFRFLAIYLIVMIIISNPTAAFLGFTNEQFVEYGREITNSQGLLFSDIGTHNLFFSHLKMYGIAVFFEIYFVSKYLKQIITTNNFGIFLAIFLYSIILGTGLSSYWLFLTTITLVMYE